MMGGRDIVTCILLEFDKKSRQMFFYIVFLILKIMLFCVYIYTQSRQFDHSKMINWANLVQKLTKIQGIL